MSYEAKNQSEKQAFPVPSTNDHDRLPGLTKREYFAAIALQGLLSNSTTFQGHSTHAELAKDAVMQADALLEELYKNQ